MTRIKVAFGKNIWQTLSVSDSRVLLKSCPEKTLSAEHASPVSIITTEHYNFTADHRLGAKNAGKLLKPAGKKSNPAVSNGKSCANYLPNLTKIRPRKKQRAGDLSIEVMSHNV